MQVNALGLPIFSKPKIIKTKDRVRKIYNISFRSSFKKDSPKNLIVMYDIPSDMKKERDWFRRHLRKFQYVMIQKSVWVGPSPLPKEFLDYVKEIKIGDGLKTFKLAKSYTSKSNNI
jgi:DNA-binding transcriptional regulator PaaX